MVRYIIDTNAETLDDIKKFTTDGYAYSQEYTEKDNMPVFIR